MADLIWKLLHPKMTPAALGYIPTFLSVRDPRPAREQFNDRYGFAGGWQSFPGFTMLPDGNLSYPGDPPVQLLAETTLRGETIRFYNHSWVAIIQPDGSYDIARMD